MPFAPCRIPDGRELLSGDIADSQVRDGERMYSLVYVSSATIPFSDEQLRALLAQCRRDNAVSEISGMLLYKGGNFMQLLEGEEARVTALYHKIATDPRHSGSMILLKSHGERRMFADWSMAFRNLNDPSVAELPGFSPFLNTNFNDREFFANPSRAQALLQFFKQSMR
jgi:hypothetical protein